MRLAKNLAQEAKRRREKLGLSLAEATRRAGWGSKAQWGRVERCRRDVQLSTVEAMAEALGCQAYELLLPPREERPAPDAPEVLEEMSEIGPDGWEIVAGMVRMRSLNGEEPSCVNSRHVHLQAMTHECPCGHKFGAPAWSSGECPKCGRQYGWDSDSGGNGWAEFEDEPGEWGV